VDFDLRARRGALEKLWRQGLSGRALLEKQSSMVDEFLVECFAHCPGKEGIALIALGGYGRRELFPFSDIDLLLLHNGVSSEVLNGAAEAIFYPLWDSGLEVGHSVRTIDACLADADADFFFQVAFLDSRFLAGDRKNFESLQHAFSKQYIDGNRKKFLATMKHHRLERHRRFGMHTYLLEPHLKESRGGLRDIQAILWTAWVVFGLRELSTMEDAGLLSSEEHNKFAEAWEQLIKIRNRLHYISGRKNEQLFFEHQEEMAKAFGYKNEKGMLAVEHFMHDVHNALQTVAVTADLFFEHVDEVLGMPPVEHVQIADHRLDKEIEVRLGRVLLLAPHALTAKPQLLMRLFWHAAVLGLPVHHRTRKYIQANLSLIDNRFRSSKRVSKMFLEILQQDGAADALAVMLETGVLAAYIPEFGALESLAQHDVYHINTVDRHLIQAVAEIHRLKEEERHIFQMIASPHILFLATLLHDIGKGFGQGHAQRGAKLVRDVGKRLGLSEKEIDCLSFLVEQHLFLIHTALRRDLEDDSLIVRCARQIKDPDRLNILYLLTIADARATGPTVWNDWKAALVLELYLKIAHLLERSDLKKPAREQGQAAVEWMYDQVREELDAEIPFSSELLPAEYIVSFAPSEVSRHLRLHNTMDKNDLLLEVHEEAGHWAILLMSTDRSGLLAKICGVLALHNLRILSAQIFTWQDGTAVDVINVVSAVNVGYQEQDWRALKNALWLAVNNRLALDYRLHKKLAHLIGRKRQNASKLPTRVEIDNASSESCSIVEIYALERIGLLYDVTRVLSDLGMNIQQAKIGSQADQIVDVFYVQDQDGKKIEDAEYQEELRKALFHVVTHESREREDIVV